MRTIAKAAVTIGAVALGGYLLSKILGSSKTENKSKEEEKKPVEETEQSTIIFDIETREMSVEKMKPGESCGAGKEKIGIVNNIRTFNLYRSFNSKRNSEIIKGSEMTPDDIRGAWLYVLEKQSKSEEISKYLQERYLRDSAERVAKELVKHEEGQ